MFCVAVWWTMSFCTGYSFGGDLTGCKSTDASAPATGTVQAGGTYTDPASGNAYVLPSSTGTGGCASSTTQGLALIVWGDGTRTLTQYTTSGAAAAVKLDGTVPESTTLQPVDPLDPPLTVTTTRYKARPHTACWPSRRRRPTVRPGSPRPASRAWSG